MTLSLGDLDKEAIALLMEQIQINHETERIARKKAEQEKEVQQIWTALDSGNYSTKRDRVAYLLNVYPDSRKNDMTLTLRYWETFQEDHFDGGHVLRNDLFKLERQTTIARLRAKIQNDYGLFLPDENVIRRRRRQEEEIRAEMLADLPSANLIQVFADETGKNDEHLIITSVWFLNVSRTASFQSAINSLAAQHKIRGEFHFAEAKKQHLDAYKAFVDSVTQRREYVSLKAIITKNPGGRAIEDSVSRLLRLHVLKGYEHEIQTGRLSSPRRIFITLDEGATTSAVAREEMRLQLQQDVIASCGLGNNVERVAEEKSKHSAALQLADLLAGALNRKYNHTSELMNHKDELADYVIEHLAPELSDGEGDSFNLYALK
jgi:hypothetical protein